MANVYVPIYPNVDTPTQTPKEISATAKYPLGTKLEARDGRIWRYCKAGGTQLSAGLMGQSPAVSAGIENEAQTGYTTNIGDTTIAVLVTTGSSLTPADLAGGYLVVEDGTGEGHYYKINTASWATSDTILTVLLDEPIQVATEATSEVTLYPNPWTGIIVTPTTVTGYCVGVTNRVVTADYYYWAQRKGPCAMVNDAGDTLVVGALGGLPATNGTAGAIGIPAITTQIYGHVMGIAAAGETALVYLNLE
jgi:hypothetical protein